VKVLGNRKHKCVCVDAQSGRRKSSMAGGGKWIQDASGALMRVTVQRESKTGVRKSNVAPWLFNLALAHGIVPNVNWTNDDAKDAIMEMITETALARKDDMEMGRAIDPEFPDTEISKLTSAALTTGFRTKAELAGILRIYTMPLDQYQKLDKAASFAGRWFDDSEGAMGNYGNLASPNMTGDWYAYADEYGEYLEDMYTTYNA